MVKLFRNFNPHDHNPLMSQTERQTERRVGGRTDEQTTCDRKTALCIVVHRSIFARMIRYDTIEQFNVDSKAERDQLKLVGT